MASRLVGRLLPCWIVCERDSWVAPPRNRCAPHLPSDADCRPSVAGTASDCIVTPRWTVVRRIEPTRRESLMNGQQPDDEQSLRRVPINSSNAARCYYGMNARQQREHDSICASCRCRLYYSPVVCVLIDFAYHPGR